MLHSCGCKLYTNLPSTFNTETEKNIMDIKCMTYKVYTCMKHESVSVVCGVEESKRKEYM